MTVRLKLALTLFVTGLVTALLVIATVVYAVQRFEHEAAYRRGNAFLQRVLERYADLFDLYARHPDEFEVWLHNLVLFDPDTQLYLLDPQGAVLVASGERTPKGFKVHLDRVLPSLGQPDAAYVMGDDPERMDAQAVIAVRPVRRGRIGGDDPVAGYLYLVSHAQQLPDGRWAAIRSSLARPILWLVPAVVAFTTLLAFLITATVTRPLRRLTVAVVALSKRGLVDGMAGAQELLPPRGRDEFGLLTSAFGRLLEICQRQWRELQGLDHFRREGVSNLSHDLRSPLTATVTCLETLQARWGAAPAAQLPAAQAEDARLVAIALRNAQNAARLVQSLGDLAKLDEPEFQLHPTLVDVGELLGDIGVRFAQRAASQGVALDVDSVAVPAFAALDVELFERAIANLVDNALKFCSPGARIALVAKRQHDLLLVQVRDTGSGIAAADLPHLFDRFYQSRHSVAPATGEGGKGLGLAIVKRIAELHGGFVTVLSPPGEGTTVTLTLRVAGAGNT